MKTSTVIVFAFFGSLVTAACSDDADILNSRIRPGGEDTGTGAAALTCSEQPDARSYVLFDGKKLEATRANENLGVNRARIKPYAVLAGEYQRVLGTVPPALAGAAGSFDEPPARWYAEAQHSGVSLNAIFSLSFEACLAHTKTAPEYAAAPTAESAGSVCTSLIRKAWSHTGTPEEVGACTNLAVTTLANEADVRRRWSYVCASILSSSQFLTF